MLQTSKLFAVLLLVTQASGQSMDLKVAPTEIGPGEAATLVWNLENRQDAYILGIGKVTGNGSIRVRPEQTINYTLLIGDTSITRSKSVSIRVKNGKRGDDTCAPDHSSFRYPKMFTAANTSTISFLSSLHRVLQDRLGFSVDEVQTPPMEPHFVFTTNCSVQSSLVFPHDQQNFPEDNVIGLRRVAYQIEISESVNRKVPGQTPALNYTLRTFVQYKKQVERIWRDEQNVAAYNKAVEMLQNEIGSHR